MPDAKLEILLTAKDMADQAFATYRKSIVGVTKAVNLLTGGMASMAGTAGLALLVSEMKKGVDAASDFEETFSKVNTLFGAEEAASLQRWGENAAWAMGLSSQAALDATGTMGNMFLQLGAGTSQASTLSTEMVQLSADLASFHNAAGGSVEVLGAMQSAFRGEYDALQRYIPTINAAAVQQQALADTGKTSAKELTALDKALAAQTIILRDAGAAVGDFARTNDTLANQQRIFSANLDNTREILGRDLLPVVTDAVMKFNDWYRADQDLINSKIREHMQGLAGTIGTIADNADTVITVMQWMGKAFMEGSGLANLNRLHEMIKAQIEIYKQVYGQVQRALGFGPTGAPGGYSADEFMGTEENYASSAGGAPSTVKAAADTAILENVEQANIKLRKEMYDALIDSFSEREKQAFDAMMEWADGAFNDDLSRLQDQVASEWANGTAHQMDTWSMVMDEAMSDAYQDWSEFEENQIRAMDNVKQQYEQTNQAMIQMSEHTAQAMQDAFADFFFDAMQGKLKTFSDYVESFLESVQRAVAQYLAQLMAQKIAGTIISWGSSGSSTSGTTGTSGTTAAGGSKGYTMDSGGYLGEGVVGVGRSSGRSYEFHENEVVLPMRRLNDGHGGGDVESIEIRIINQSGTQLESTSQNQRFDGSRMIVDVVIDSITRNVGGLADVVAGARR